MKKKLFTLLLTTIMTISLVACGTSQTTEKESSEATVEQTTETEQEPDTEEEEATEPTEVSDAAALEDGVYQVDFTTDSGMFHVNEAMNGHGALTVEDGKMTVHISLVSKKILNLYVGLAADAEGDEANWLQPTEDEITYEDGTTDTVYGFDVPVENLDEEFDLALIGEKGTWYDHKVSVSNPVAQ
ncbi:hypothetical protein SAMN02910298_00138 [Pseudobutyrivibrio sp. YE44]|uniref:hypothetical protein n=1 Tax=Pseudobutyrivibrio sp. YE44 TaxID=1520802 RepID=UPI00088E47C1|nr:hypothetical protein [Pseudobutyrivibrio sp. YE44]SDB05774.1 hypothetical protein SAMN02910298_00138 [Pseudobutyrivibrio sp. YE44]